MRYQPPQLTKYYQTWKKLSLPQISTLIVRLEVAVSHVPPMRLLVLGLSVGLVRGLGLGLGYNPSSSYGFVSSYGVG